MKKSKERIAIEKELNTIDDAIESARQQRETLARREQTLQYSKEVFLRLLNLPAPEAKPPEPSPLPQAADPKPKRTRKPKAISKQDDPAPTYHHSSGNSSDQDDTAPTHHCLSCNRDVIGANNHGVPLCPICGSEKMEGIGSTK